jgi:hypothetical protein
MSSAGLTQMPTPNPISREQALQEAVNMIDKDDFQGAIAIYSRLLSQSPEYKLYVLRAGVKVLFRNYAAALADMREAEKLAQVEGNQMKIDSIRARIANLEADMSRSDINP